MIECIHVKNVRTVVKLVSANSEYFPIVCYRVAQFYLSGNQINSLNNLGVDSSPCLSSYNWAFRISLLTISILCICLIFVLTYYIYKYRKIKVFKVASPVFLSITLLGCAVMYAEVGENQRIVMESLINDGFPRYPVVVRKF